MEDSILFPFFTPGHVMKEQLACVRLNGWMYFFVSVKLWRGVKGVK